MVQNMKIFQWIHVIPFVLHLPVDNDWIDMALDDRKMISIPTKLHLILNPRTYFSSHTYQTRSKKTNSSLALKFNSLIFLFCLPIAPDFSFNMNINDS